MAKPHHKSGMTRVPLTQARARFGEIMRRVQAGKEHFVLERDGVPVAALIDIDEFEDYLELQDPEVGRIIEESHNDYQAGRSRPAEDFLAELKVERGSETVRKSRVKDRHKAG